MLEESKDLCFVQENGAEVKDKSLFHWTARQREIFRLLLLMFIQNDLNNRNAHLLNINLMCSLSGLKWFTQQDKMLFGIIFFKLQLLPLWMTLHWCQPGFTSVWNYCTCYNCHHSPCKIKSFKANISFCEASLQSIINSGDLKSTVEAGLISVKCWPQMCFNFTINSLFKICCVEI